MPPDLTKWAEELTQRVYEEWRTKHASWKQGVKVFYSPVRLNPPLMIISLNPGGDEVHFQNEDKEQFEGGVFAPPSVTEYLTRDHRMARSVRRFFKGNEKLLEESVAFPLLFFRSKNAKMLGELRRKTNVESFCFQKVREIVETLQPKAVLVQGLETYALLAGCLGGFTEEQSIRGKNGRIAAKANWRGIPILAMRHPTGSRISREDFEQIREEFFRMMGGSSVQSTLG